MSKPDSRLVAIHRGRYLKDTDGGWVHARAISPHIRNHGNALCHALTATHMCPPVPRTTCALCHMRPLPRTTCAHCHMRPLPRTTCALCHAPHVPCATHHICPVPRTTCALCHTPHVPSATHHMCPLPRSMCGREPSCPHVHHTHHYRLSLGPGPYVAALEYATGKKAQVSGHTCLATSKWVRTSPGHHNLPPLSACCMRVSSCSCPPAGLTLQQQSLPGPYGSTGQHILTVAAWSIWQHGQHILWTSRMEHANDAGGWGGTPRRTPLQ